MEKLKERITENGIDYILAGDYYIPDLKLPEENRPIGRYGRLHREYLKQEHPARYSSLILTGTLWTYLADLNEQAEERLDLIIEQMKAAEGVTACPHYIRILANSQIFLDGIAGSVWIVLFLSSFDYL